MTYIMDDSNKIPEYIRNMSRDELKKEITKLENEERAKKNLREQNKNRSLNA